MTGETLSYWLKRIQQLRGEDVAVLVIGDFNDEPFNRSLTEYAMSVNSSLRVQRGSNPYLFNLMYPLTALSRGTIFFGGSPLVIDQFMVSKGFLKSTGKFDVDKASLKIESFPGMISKSGEPIRFGRPSQKSTYNPKGFSDHLPVSLVIMEK